jgi:hypothetical protein
MRLTHVLVCKTAADPHNDNTQKHHVRKVADGPASAPSMCTKSSWFKQRLGTSLFARFFKGARTPRINDHPGYSIIPLLCCLLDCRQSRNQSCGMRHLTDPSELGDSLGTGGCCGLSGLGLH